MGGNATIHTRSPRTDVGLPSTRPALSGGNATDGVVPAVPPACTLQLSPPWGWECNRAVTKDIGYFEDLQLSPPLLGWECDRVTFLLGSILNNPSTKPAL